MTTLNTSSNFNESAVNILSPVNVALEIRVRMNGWMDGWIDGWRCRVIRIVLGFHSLNRFRESLIQCEGGDEINNLSLV
jgi:hypothetical protein